MRLFAALGAASLVAAEAAAQMPRPGGVINFMQREDLAAGFAIHETATIATVWPALPCLNNLVPHHYIYSYGRMQDVWLDR